ncbi:serine/threonine-protein kinase ATM isoform X2 [Drosophila mojavensis]|uniref:serine/threonine-protein kinase ATM isoform X2 n=1 Tax=Drosophila mojavensis TaxID=7230 RepID=UPI0013EEB9E8|nr:serine/threonine-protein kinase ATM isoform X2 [Drosophila mojavensis]
MNPLLNEIQRIITEMHCDKPTTRNKAIEQLDQKLTSSKEALNGVLGKKQELCWKAVFNATKEAIFKHSANLQEANEKSFKTLSDKCYLYGNAIDKIIEYNLEMGRSGSHFLSKSTIFNAFEEGIKQRIVVRHFGNHFINLLDRGIFLSSTYIENLKVSEYSCVLSYLFELNLNNDELLRSKILKCITKTLQLAQKRVQLHADLVDYLPMISNFAKTANTAERKQEIVRLYEIIVTELSVNYHHKLCVYMQEIVPKLCDFHNDDIFRDDIKNVFFNCITLSLRALYPKMNSHDFDTFRVPIDQTWRQTVLKLRTIVDMEIRKHFIGRGQSSALNLFSDKFIQMAAIVVYIVNWHTELQTAATESEETPSKRVRVDKLEEVIQLIDKQETKFNVIWFAIFAELMQFSGIINAANYQLALSTTVDVLLIYGNGKNLRNVRLCLTSLLQRELELLKEESIPVNFLSEQWTKIATFLIAETRPAADEIIEKQLILRSFIRYKKLNQASCNALLQSITTNEMLRRNECMETIRYIFINAQQCGLKKSSNSLEPIIKWAYATEKSSATQMIHNIAAIDPKLMADTFAIGIINFLDGQQLQQLAKVQTAITTADGNDNLQLLLYKYNKKLICLDEQFQSVLLQSNGLHKPIRSNAKNCLSQQNYELLMRMLNISTSSEHSITSLLRDLKCLHKLVCTIERLLHYKVFDAENFTNCPLIKRIGLFLSHIEFQYKALQSELSSVDSSDLRDILQQQMLILDVFHSNDTLLHYMERQPIEMLLEFIGVLLNQICATKSAVESSEQSTLVASCLHILGNLCANSSYNKEAFRHIARNLKLRSKPQDVLLVLKMLCKCKTLWKECIVWLVERLKEIFLHHFANIQFISDIIDEIPTVILFSCFNEHEVDDMLSAIISLMRIALKKAYPASLSVKIVRSIGLIAQRCPHVLQMPNFNIICYSTTKFLTMPTIELRLAAITTLTQLLNANFCVSTEESDAMHRYADHLAFTKELYAQIDWKKLTFIGEDLEQNSHAVVIQALISFFAFSTYHQDFALQDLLPYCAHHKLTAFDFCDLRCQVPCYNRSMRQVFLPYTDSLVHKWISKKWSPSKFPYFLSYDTKDDFVKGEVNNMMAYMFIYGTPEEIQRFKKYLNSNATMVILQAFLAVDLSDSNESQFDEFRQHHKNLKRNLQLFEMRPMMEEVSAMALYRTIRLLLDKDELERLFGGTALSIRQPKWFNISAESLFRAMSQLVKGKKWSTDARIQVISTLMFEQPMMLIDLLGMLKSDCYQAVLPSHVVNSFFLYCTIADAVSDAIRNLESMRNADTTLRDVHAAHFARDIWFFVCRFLLHSKCDRLHRSALKFLQLMLPKDSFQNQDLAKLLIACLKHVESQELKTMTTKIIIAYIEKYKAELQLQGLFDEADDGCEHLQELRQRFEPALPEISKQNFEDYIRAFLEPNSSERLHGLREYIAEHKEELQNNDELLFDLVSRLIQMVRESPKYNQNMDALKCLAEIGPIKMKHISYYFLTDYESIQPLTAAMEQFVAVIMEALERHIFDFDVNTHKAVIQVAREVVNSRSAEHLIDSYPYLRIFCVGLNTSSFLNSFVSIPQIDWLAMLKATEHLDYEPWLCQFMGSVFKACHWPGFDEFAFQSVDFASTCLQTFVKLVMANRDVHLTSLCEMLNYFFENSAHKTTGFYQDKRIIKRFLYMCECVRVVNNWSIPIDLGNVVKASNHCQAYFMSIMYLELWVYSVKPTDSPLHSDSFQTYAKTAYKSIGCLDAIPGFLNPLSSRVDFLSLSNNLSEALLEADNQNESSTSKCLDIMNDNGMLTFANFYQRSCEDIPINYEILWRLCQWDEQTERTHHVDWSNNLEQEYNKHHYLALMSINKREQENTLAAINNAYQCVQKILQDISIECLQSVYKYMTWLCTLQQTEDFYQVCVSSSASNWPPRRSTKYSTNGKRS